MKGIGLYIKNVKLDHTNVCKFVSDQDAKEKALQAIYDIHDAEWCWCDEIEQHQCNEKSTIIGNFENSNLKECKSKCNDDTRCTVLSFHSNHKCKLYRHCQPELITHQSDGYADVH